MEQQAQTGEAGQRVTAEEFAAARRRNRRGRGRPPAMTEDVRERILVLMRNGNYIETAAAVAGVHKDTVFLWLREGRKECDRRAAWDAMSATERKARPADRPDASGTLATKADFFIAVERAQAEWEAHALNAIRMAGEGEHADWKALAWRLERQHPKRYGHKTQVTGDADDPLVVKTVIVTGKRAETVDDWAGTFKAALRTVGDAVSVTTEADEPEDETDELDHAR